MTQGGGPSEFEVVGTFVDRSQAAAAGASLLALGIESIITEPREHGTTASVSVRCGDAPAARMALQTAALAARTPPSFERARQGVGKRRLVLAVIISAVVFGIVGLVMTVAGLLMALVSDTDCTGGPFDLVVGGGLAAAIGVVFGVTGLVLAAFADVPSQEKVWKLVGAMLGIAISLSPVVAWYVALRAASDDNWFTCAS